MNITLHRLANRLVADQARSAAGCVQARGAQFSQARGLRDAALDDKKSVSQAPGDMFEDARQGYSAKTTYELLRAVMVFQMCNMDTLVKYQGQLLRTARTVLGKAMFGRLMRGTIYGQFIAGERNEEILSLAARNQKHGVGSMFAYTAAEMHGTGTPQVGNETYQQSFFDSNFAGINRSINMAAESYKTEFKLPIATSKFTFLVEPDLLLKLSDMIDANNSLIEKMLQQNPSKVQELLEKVALLCNNDDYTKTLAPIAKRNSGDTDESRLVTLQTSVAFHLQFARCPAIKNALKDAKFITMSDKEYRDTVKLWDQMNQLTDLAVEKGIVLTWDAEQTYLQTGISLLALDSMRVYNRERPVVQNTYQTYLKKTHSIIKRDLETAKNENFCVGAKVVRGAYIDEERRLASEKGYEDPVNVDYEATTASYERVARELLDSAKNRVKGEVQVLFATHNEDTIRTLVQLIHERQISMKGDVVTFAQLLGMRDHIAFILGKADFPAVKLLHYGQIEECVAYLSRRALENKSAVPTADKERKMLTKEFVRRFTSGEVLKRKSQ